MDMMRTQHPRGVRLGVKYEAKALVASLGSAAFSVARLRAEEASSADMARDWGEVARLVARNAARHGESAATAFPASAPAAPIGADWPFV